MIIIDDAFVIERYSQGYEFFHNLYYYIQNLNKLWMNILLFELPSSDINLCNYYAVTETYVGSYRFFNSSMVFNIKLCTSYSHIVK